MSDLGIGIIGCGNISASYLTRAPLFRGIEVRAVADLDPDAAAARAAEYGVRAMSVEDLLAADDIDIIVNLTIPAAHEAVSRAILEAGKHAFSEKPMALSAKGAQALRDLAASKGRRMGCAPDTFLGGGHQAVRGLVDDGSIGTVTHGTCHVMSRGMEHWHPNPDFFFVEGGGPILDLGPYYVTQLVNLLGPVAKVAALTGCAQDRRTITSEPRAGETIPVETPTTIHALIQFEGGAQITLGASWDCKSNGHHNIELYGTSGSIFAPDPNFFGGLIRVSDAQGVVSEQPMGTHPLAIPNRETGQGPQADYRTVGLADMADAIRANRPHRCGDDLALHVTEVLEAILRSGESGQFERIETTCNRPAALDAAAAQALLR